MKRLLTPAFALILTFGIATSASAFDTQTCNGDLLCTQPITWNVIGLDSNKVTDGPDTFMVGTRVCNTNTLGSGVTFNNVASTFVWDSANSWLENKACVPPSILRWMKLAVVLPLETSRN